MTDRWAKATWLVYVGIALLVLTWAIWLHSQNGRYQIWGTVRVTEDKTALVWVDTRTGETKIVARDNIFTIHPPIK